MRTKMICDCGTCLEEGTIEDCKDYGTQCDSCGMDFLFVQIDEDGREVDTRIGRD